MQLLKFLADVVNLQPEFNLPETINTGLASPARLSLAALTLVVHVDILDCHDFLHLRLLRHDQLP